MKQEFIKTYYINPIMVVLYVFTIAMIVLITYSIRHGIPKAKNSHMSEWWTKIGETKEAKAVTYFGMFFLLIAALCGVVPLLLDIPTLVREDYREKTGIVTNHGSETVCIDGETYTLNKGGAKNGDELEIVYLPYSKNAVVVKYNGKEIKYRD